MPCTCDLAWLVTSSGLSCEVSDSNVIHLVFIPKAGVRYAITRNSHVAISSINHQCYYDIMGRRIKTDLLLDKIGIIKVLPR